MPWWLLLYSLAWADDPPVERHPAFPGKVVGLIVSTDPTLPWGDRYRGAPPEGAPPVVYELLIDGWSLTPVVDGGVFAPGANPFGIDGPAHVALIEINGGAGAAETDPVRITAARVIDDRRGHDLDVLATVIELRKRFDADVQAHDDAFREAEQASCEAVKTAQPGEGTWSERSPHAGIGVFLFWNAGPTPLGVDFSHTASKVLERTCSGGAPCAAAPETFGCGAVHGASAWVTKRGHVDRYTLGEVSRWTEHGPLPP